MAACPTCGEKSAPRLRFCPQCGARLASGGRSEEIHRQATVVTSDLKGSTALGETLDPESLREVLTRYFDEMRAVFESHGGTIEKIIGDAIVAVFGIAARRDDDALRAVQAGAESMRVLTTLNDQLEATWGVRLVTRTGVASGEVTVGEAIAGSHVLTGETMRIAGVMEQNAPPLEVLLAESTQRLVGGSVTVEPYGPVFAKGSSEPLPAFRLLSVISSDALTTEAGAAVDGVAQTCGVCGDANAPMNRFCGMCGTPLVRRAEFHESRKTVSIVFADPKPAALDGSVPSAEALGDVMSRYFEGMQRALDRHGATVEKFIGDAVMAVFGLPTRHEDDALRAVRAAVEMQRALPALNDAFERDRGVRLGNHIGVNTGEVVAGDAGLGQRLVTGDTVNVAARLEQAAGAGEVLIGDLTYRLVRGAVTVEPMAPLTLKGKAEPVPAYRLVAVSDRSEGFERRSDAPMVGREDEMAELREALAGAIAGPDCRMTTVIGDAGVGKSRLVAEFVAESALTATVIHGRCLPYGEGITFWPLREAVREAAGVESNDAPEEALGKLHRLIPDAAVVDRLASAIGLSIDVYPVAEIVWASRKFLEGLGQERPTVMQIDDLQWASPTFLELVGSVVETVSDAPVLILGTSRPDFLAEHPDWGTDPKNRRIVLQPLTAADAERVVRGLLGDAGIPEQVQARIAQGAAGNPLFVEQLLSMLIDDGTLRQVDGRWEVAGDLLRLEVPPTIHALLAARIDLLEAAERAVIEPASVIGQTFARAAVHELAPPPVQPALDLHLGALTRKQLIGPMATTDEEAAYRFPNILIRDAAYGGLLKRARADLHERFVAWGEEVNRRRGGGQEFEEIQGFHLEQAYGYLTELGVLDDHARSVGARAADKLAAAGRRALGRGDMHAAANLLQRAAATLPAAERPHLRLLPDLGEALMELGEFEHAQRVLNEALVGARALGDASLGAQSELVTILVGIFSAEEGMPPATALDAVRRAVPVFEREGNEAGLALAARLLFATHGIANQYALAAAAAESVIEHARLAGDLRLEHRGVVGYSQSAVYGPTPVPIAVARLEGLLQEVADDRRTEALVRLALAQLYAMRGEFKRARGSYRHAIEMLNDLGSPLLSASNSTVIGQIELVAGDLIAAERELREDLKLLQAMGGSYLQSGVIGLLARVLYARGQIEEAHSLTEQVERMASADDIDAQVEWRAVRAMTLVRLGRAQEAEELSMQAVRWSQEADAPLLQALALEAQALAAGRVGDAAAQARSAAAARALYEAKGDLAGARSLAASRSG